MKSLRLLLSVVIVCSVLAVSGLAAQPPVRAQDSVTLTIWDGGTIETDNALYETLRTEFEAAHPGVKIERVVRSPEDMQTVVKLGLADKEGPDIVQINQSQQDMGEAVRAGLLLNLTPYAEQYGWTLAPSLMARNSYSADGETFGVGNLYGVSLPAELMGVYYRKDIFARYGLEVPQTFADFEAILATLKQNGETPISAAGLGGFAMMWLYMELQNVYLGEDGLSWPDSFVYHQHDVSFNMPASVQAAAKLKEWADAGYFTPGFEGIGYDDYVTSFKNGGEAMVVVGSWESGSFAAGPLGDQIGFFLMPPMTPGTLKNTVGGIGIPFAIRASTDQADLAAEYLDWMLSDRSMGLLIEMGVVPAFIMSTDDVELEEDTLFADVVKAWAYMNATNTVGHYLDWATPTIGQTMNDSVQELLAGVISPEQFVETVDEDYQSFK